MSQYENRLPEWLTEQMENRNLNASQVAAIGGLGGAATITRIVRGERSAGPRACQAIAEVFDVPVEHILRLAGHLPPEDDDDDIEAQLLEKLKALTIAQRRRVLAAFREFEARSQAQEGQATENNSPAHLLPTVQ